MRNLSHENEFCTQFHSQANQSHFHKNGFALRLALKQSHKGNWKWPIKIYYCSRVCVPGLHISLGIFKNLFDELEEQCFELDKKTHMKLAVQNGQLSEENSREKILAL